MATAGFAALSLRAAGITFIMITLALGEILWGLAYRWISFTNGDNGINVTSRPAPFGLPPADSRPLRTTTYRCVEVGCTNSLTSDCAALT